MIWFLAECAVFVILLMGLIPLRIDARYSAEGLVILGYIWKTSVQLYPRPKRAGDSAKKRDRKKDRTVSQQTLKKLLLKNGLHTLFKVMEHMKIEFMRVYVTAGGPDPFQAAMAYAGAGTLLSALDVWAAGRSERTDFRADVDFSGGGSSIYGRVRLRAQAYRVVEAVFCFGMRGLRGYSQCRKAKTEG